MSKMICVPCNVEFPSDTVYLDHKTSGHKRQMDKAVFIDPPPTPATPPGVPTNALPTPEFMEMVNRIESPKDVAESNPKPSQHPSELPKPIPLVLTYKYIGECPEHRSPIDTLELDVVKEHFCIAYCSTGKHQIETKQVAKL